MTANKIFTVPNIITFSGFIAGIVSAFFFLRGDYWTSAFVFYYAMFTDFLDGWTARKWEWSSILGKEIDPIRDKFLLVVLGFIFGSFQFFFIPIFILVIVFEISSLYFSKKIRAQQKKHFVADESKAATTIQFFASIGLFLTFLLFRETHYFLYLFFGFAEMIIVSSFLRAFVYRKIWIALSSSA